MKKILAVSFIAVFLSVNFVFALDLNQLFTQVKTELLKKGVSQADVNAVQPAATSLLGMGINKESLIKIIKDLSSLQVSGDTLNAPLQALQSLIQSGEKPNIASNIMSLAISHASAQKLKGNAAVGKIVEFINQKKGDLLKLKQQAESKFQEQKDNLGKKIGFFVNK